MYQMRSEQAQNIMYHQKKPGLFCGGESCAVLALVQGCGKLLRMGQKRAYMSLDHELLHSIHEVVDLWHHQPSCDDCFEQVEGRNFAARGLNVPKRPL